jgi:hypothetical protein
MANQQVIWAVQEIVDENRVMGGLEGALTRNRPAALNRLIRTAAPDTVLDPKRTPCLLSKGVKQPYHQEGKSYYSNYSRSEERRGRLLLVVDHARKDNGRPREGERAKTFLLPCLLTRLLGYFRFSDPWHLTLGVVSYS